MLMMMMAMMKMVLLMMKTMVGLMMIVGCTFTYLQRRPGTLVGRAGPAEPSHQHLQNHQTQPILVRTGDGVPFPGMQTFFFQTERERDFFEECFP